MIDWTPIVLAAATFVFGVLKLVADRQINARVKDEQAVATLNKALDNGLGAMQQAVELGIRSHPLQSDLPGVPPATAAGVQYVLDHAKDELARFGIDEVAVADKLNARLGREKLGAALQLPR